VTTSDTGSGGVVEVTATVQNQGDALDTQFVDLLAGNDTVDRTGLELAPGTNGSVTMTHEVNETTTLNITVATDDDETTATVTWDTPSSVTSALSTPARANGDRPITVNAAIESTGFGAFAYGCYRRDR
jgi:hypothetical protein